MENDQKQHYQVDDRNRGTAKLPVMQETQEVREVVPGVPIVRSSTPRPLTFEAMQAISAQSLKSQQGIQPEEPGAAPPFPATAPSAPPLPEELGESEEEDVPSTAFPTSRASHSLDRAKLATEEKREFLWLFEYGPEMDSALLNSPERLDGLALLYGPAVLKGYSIMIGEVGTPGERGGSGRFIATLVPGSDPQAEVWGVLYRIPRRLHERTEGSPSLLDSAHAATSPQSLFRPVKAVVHETLRDREITCITYIATDMTRQWLRPFSGGQEGGGALLAQQLAAAARQHKLPEHYLSKYASRTASVVPAAAREFVTIATARGEQNTEPIPAIKQQRIEAAPLPAAKKSQEAAPQSPWLVVFASYLLLILLLVLAFAVLQGLGFASALLTTSFAPLAVPWLVLVYGLLGGCMSSIITLGRSRPFNPPVFVIITWFARPYIGAALALLAYLFLTSGLFVVTTTNAGQNAVFLLAGALAGLSESWLFAARR